MNREKFIDNLTEARKSRGLTQKQVALALGISDKTYSKWETGENEPDISSLCRLGEVFGCAAADFFAEEAPKKDGIRSELETLTRAQAMRRIREIIDEAYDGFCDNGLYWMRRWSGGDEEAEKCWKEVLSAEPTPEEPGAACCDMNGGGVFLRWWDREMNLRLLMLPGEAGDAFLEEDGEALDGLFDLMKRARRFLPLLRREPSREQKLYTPEFLAQGAGLPPEEAETALQDMERYGFCLRQAAETAGGHWLYTPADTRILRAILALAHLLQREMENRQALQAKRGEEA